MRRKVAKNRSALGPVYATAYCSHYQSFCDARGKYSGPAIFGLPDSFGIYGTPEFDRSVCKSCVTGQHLMVQAINKIANKYHFWNRHQGRDHVM